MSKDWVLWSLKKLERKNLEDKMYRLNLTLVENDVKVDRIIYSAELKPLSLPLGKNEVRKLKEHLGMFSIKNCKKWVFWVQVILKGVFLATLEIKFLGNTWLIILKSNEKTIQWMNLALQHVWNDTNTRQETTWGLKNYEP